jgi:transcriptional regulator with XRE-family HTH domain
MLEKIMAEAMEHRKKKLISKNSIAVKMGVSAQRITAWENGKNKPRADYFLKYLSLIDYPLHTEKMYSEQYIFELLKKRDSHCYYSEKILNIKDWFLQINNK